MCPLPGGRHAAFWRARRRELLALTCVGTMWFVACIGTLAPTARWYAVPLAHVRPAPGAHCGRADASAWMEERMSAAADNASMPAHVAVLNVDNASRVNTARVLLADCRSPDAGGSGDALRAAERGALPCLAQVRYLVDRYDRLHNVTVFFDGADAPLFEPPLNDSGWPLRYSADARNETTVCTSDACRDCMSRYARVSGDVDDDDDDDAGAVYPPRAHVFVANASGMAVTRDAVRARPLAFWRHWLALLSAAPAPLAHGADAAARAAHRDAALCASCFAVRRAWAYGFTGSW